MLSDPVQALGFGQRLLGDAAALVIDAQAAIKPLMDFHPSPGVARPLGAGRNVDHMGAKADGVVVAHHPAIFETEELLEALRLRRIALSRRHGSRLSRRVSYPPIASLNGAFALELLHAVTAVGFDVLITLDNPGD